MFDEIHLSQSDKQQIAKDTSQQELLRMALQRLMEGVAQSAAATLTDAEIQQSKFYKYSESKNITTVRNQLIRAWVIRLADKMRDVS